MDLLEKIAYETETRVYYIKLYDDHKADIEEGRLPAFKFERDSVQFEAECLLRIYSISFHLRELAKEALKDDSIFLEQTEKEKLEEMVNGLTREIDNMEQHIVQRLYKGYEAQW